jgi:hypothetical protein
MGAKKKLYIHKKKRLKQMKISQPKGGKTENKRGEIKKRCKLAKRKMGVKQGLSILYALLL